MKKKVAAFLTAASGDGGGAPKGRCIGCIGRSSR
jgi:hypothetical protein